MEIFILWSMNADSWTGGRTLVSIHKTLEGAEKEIPENIRTESMLREAEEPYVKNYTYRAIEKRVLND